MSVFGKMMKFTLSLIIILVITFMITFSTHTIAQGNYGATISTMKANQQSNKQQIRVKSPKQAAQLAQRRFGGKVLKVQVQKTGYRVKLIKKSGHIIVISVDAKSGRISGR